MSQRGSLVSGGVGGVGQPLHAVVNALRPFPLAPDVALHACQPVLQLRLPLHAPRKALKLSATVQRIPLNERPSPAKQEGVQPNVPLTLFSLFSCSRSSRLFPDDEARRCLVYLKYWTLNLNPLMVYPNVLFPPNFIINQTLLYGCVTGGGGGSPTACASSSFVCSAAFSALFWSWLDGRIRVQYLRGRPNTSKLYHQGLYECAIGGGENPTACASRSFACSAAFSASFWSWLAPTARSIAGRMADTLEERAVGLYLHVRIMFRV